jgi:hypothetical protein
VLSLRNIENTLSIARFQQKARSKEEARKEKEKEEKRKRKTRNQVKTGGLLFFLSLARRLGGGEQVTKGTSFPSFCR